MRKDDGDLGRVRQVFGGATTFPAVTPSDVQAHAEDASI